MQKTRFEEEKSIIRAIITWAFSLGCNGPTNLKLNYMCWFPKY